MTKTWSISFVASLLAVVCVPSARAVDISPQLILIKAVPKKTITLRSADRAIQLSGAVEPDVSGATIHVYSATDDQCTVLPPGAGWAGGKSQWRFRDRATGAVAQIRDGSLSIKLISDVTFDISDNDSQNPVNAQVRFGNGTKYCMRCSGQNMGGFLGTKMDTNKEYFARHCFPDACDPEPPTCN
jgi:hypothetical protein